MSDMECPRCERTFESLTMGFTESGRMTLVCRDCLTDEDRQRFADLMSY